MKKKKKRKKKKKLIHIDLEEIHLGVVKLIFTKKGIILQKIEIE